MKPILSAATIVPWLALACRSYILVIRSWSAYDSNHGSARLVSEAGGREHTNGSVPVLSCCQSSHCTPWRACCHAIFSPSSNAASRKRLQCAGCWRWRASSAGHGKIAAFPPLWSVKELNESFVVQDATGQPLAYVYFEDEPQRLSLPNGCLSAVLPWGPPAWCEKSMVTGFADRCRKSLRQGPISLGAKQTGERSAGNLHAAFDEAGAGNVARSRVVTLADERARQPGTQTST